MNPRPCTSDFNLDRHLIPFLQDCPFFAELSRHLGKFASRDIPTACVTYDPVSDQIAAYFNPDFMKTLPNFQVRGVIKHEFYHPSLGHLTARKRFPDKAWNIATDLAINSLITENAGKPADATDESTDDELRILPKFALVPGRWPSKRDGTDLTAVEKKASELGALIAGFPKMKASEWYFEQIMAVAQEKCSPGSDPFEGEAWIGSMDDHSPWDDIPDEQREYVEGKVKTIVARAVRHADSLSSGWGDIPVEIRDKIRKSVSTIVDWRSVLRQFVGTLVRGARASSIKRINRRYPYVHPGVKRSYSAKLLVARDESGSVSKQMLELFFGELNSLTRKVEIDFLPFDSDCSNNDVVRWSKGTIPEAATMRTKCGGTDFNAPTRVFNDPRNRGRWDGLLILTDGGAPAPIPSRAKRGWVLAPGCKLIFNTSELQIPITSDKPMTDAFW